MVSKEFACILDASVKKQNYMVENGGVKIWVSKKSKVVSAGFRTFFMVSFLFFFFFYFESVPVYHFFHCIRLCFDTRRGFKGILVLFVFIMCFIYMH